MNFKLWDSYRGKIRSKKGGWIIGQSVQSHGFDLTEELVGKYSYMQVIMLNATGRMPDKRLADWIEAVHICLSWPDPRIWCNRIGALGGTVGLTPITATAAGLMASDSRSYGGRTLVEGLNLIQRTKKAIDNGAPIESFIDGELRKHGGKPHLMGYSRPIAKGDERIPAMERVTKHLGFKVGAHLKLAYQIENILSQRFDEKMNINGYISGFLADQGYTPEEVHQIFSVMVFSGITACYVDTIARPRGTFAPLGVEDAVYMGKPARSI
jgi:citrate synthase